MHLHLLKTKLNLISPLVCLPFDVLQEIVRQVSIIDPGGRAGDGGLGWIKVGHLCRALRASLFNMHSLWASTICEFPSAYAELAKRAGDVPLTLTMDERNSESRHLIPPKLFDFFVNNLSKAKAFKVREGSRSRSLGLMWIGAAMHLAGRELPLVEDICIDVSPRTALELRPNALDYTALPMITPRLRKLHLENCWMTFSPTTLVSLELMRSFRPQEDTLPPLPLFIDLLRQCANLQELQIVQCMPQPPALNNEPAMDVIELPSLKLLAVWAPLPKMLSFWEYVNIPRSAYLNMGCDLFTVRADMQIFDQGNEVIECYTDVRRMDFLQSLGEHLRSDLTLADAPISGASFVEGHDGVEILVLELWTSSTPPSHLRDQALRPRFFTNHFSPRMTIAFDAWPYSTTSDYQGFIATLDVAWSSFPLQFIRTLEIGVVAPYTAQQWHGILSRFTQVESLALEKVSSSYVLGAFAKDLIGPDNFLLLPKMRSLTIDLIKFSDFQKLTDWSVQSPGMGLDGFLDVLQYRSQQGSPLIDLVVKELSSYCARPRDMDSFFLNLDCIVSQWRVGIYIAQYASNYSGWDNSEEYEGEEVPEGDEVPP
ncbi:hypothetical protein PENSPDRAFT_650211 [Peniophora sp. CONT]|nr:hypothetical protein PENSPDRAFT_650211 [Peniophora sp. CONT]